MNFDLIVQIIINILITGAVYVLVASGFSLTYSVTRVLHLAHGALLVTGAYILYWALEKLHWPFIGALLLSLIIVLTLGLLIQLGIYEPLKKRGSGLIILLLASVATLLFIENLMIAFFGAIPRTISLLGVKEGLTIIGKASITYWQIVIIIVALVLLIALALFLKKTKFGQAIRAMADNLTIAQILGMNPKKLARLTILLSSALAGLAAVLIALEFNVEPLMGTKFIIKAFTAAVIGGVGSVPGAIIGSFIVAGTENIGVWVLGAAFKDIAAFLLLFIFLLLKPEGLFGHKK